MNYPVWELSSAGGGLLIAVIAVVHVFVSHFAVGGGLFLVMVEMKGLKEKSSAILAYAKTHAKFFLLVTMVFSAATGVGIWFTITLLSPAAASKLIHIFVFGFAAEWVFFTLEIIAVFLYYYTFGKIEERAHLTLGWLYFIFAFISLVLINGIITFMLTPGEWLITRNFWDGFFNPTFLPSLFFRTGIALVFAGLFGFITAVFIKDPDINQQMTAFCAKWLFIPFIGMVICALWYYTSLPEPQKTMIGVMSPETRFFTRIFVIVLPILFLGGLLMAQKLPVNFKKYLAFFLLFTGLAYMGSFEWIRESGRRPYLIHGFIYSNAILVADEENINEKGLLQNARWTRHKEVTRGNMTAAGKEIFLLSCSSCHSVGGLLNDIIPLTDKYTVFSLDAHLNGMGKINTYMPRFFGSETERRAVAAYIVEELHGKPQTPHEISSKLASHDQNPEPPAWPEIPFDEQKDDYILAAWHRSELASTGILTPASIIDAILIKRGELPEVITDQVDLTVEEIVSDINGQQIVSVAAVGTENKTVLARTHVSVPVPVPAGCRNCHGGNQPDETLLDILSVHDRISRTDLLERQKAGKNVSCQTCHQDENNAALNLSASIHGFHANYLTDRAEGACIACHPASAFKGVHQQIGLDCTSCHGQMADHALSLLLLEKKKGKPSAEPLMAHLKPIFTDSLEEIKPRQPWVNQTDCLNCHIDFEPPEEMETFNLWTAAGEDLYQSRTCDAGLKCQACHGSVHALFPEKDNIQPMQYQNTPYPLGSNKNCKVCHTVDMEDEMHHPNSLTEFRNTW